MSDRHAKISDLPGWPYVQEKATDWKAGLLDFQHVRVYVDERDGFGWRRTYEQLDLAEVAGSVAPERGEQQ